MDQQAIDRLAAKSDRQMLLMELQDYRLSPIEAKAIVQRLQQYLDEHNSNQLGEGQIFYPASANYFASRAIARRIDRSRTAVASALFVSAVSAPFSLAMAW